VKTQKRSMFFKKNQKISIISLKSSFALKISSSI